MDETKTKGPDPIVIIGALLAIGVVIYLVLKGSSSSSSGVVFGQADPASVQAVYSANAADVAANDQASASVANTKTQAQAGTIEAYLNYLGLTNTNSAATSQAQIGATAAERIASTQGSTAEAIATSNNQATIASAQSAASAAGVVAGDEEAAAETGYNAAARATTNAANAQAGAEKTAANDSLWGSIIGGVGSILGSFFSPIGAAGSGSATVSDGGALAAPNPYAIAAPQVSSNGFSGALPGLSV